MPKQNANGNARPDTRMMGVVHDAFRRDFVRLDTVLRAAEPLDQSRREALAAHAEWMMDLLHHHHEGEDAGLWPLVRQRNPGAGALLDRMSADHAAIGPGIERVRTAARRFGSDPGDAGRADLATALTELAGSLLPHLRDEEVDAMPVVSATLTAAEYQRWDQKFNIRGKSVRQLGAEGHWLRDGLDPERYQLLVHLVPAPVRFVLIKGFARPYRTGCALRWGPQVSVGPL